MLTGRCRLQALVAFKKAADLNPQNKEVTDKVKILSKLTRKYANASKQVGSSSQHKGLVKSGLSLPKPMHVRSQQLWK